MTRRSALIVGAVCLGVAVVLGVLVIVRPGIIQGLDDAWNIEMGEWRSPALIGFALVMNSIGGGWIATLVIPLGLAVLLLLVRGWRSAAFALVAFLGSALVVQAIKHALGRPRPQDLLIASDFGSFPSGHTSNAATIAIVLSLLFPHALTLIGGALWVIAMAFSRTVLSVHWFSDTVGGALAGAGAALLVAAVVWPWIVRGRNGRGLLARVSR
ncbi:undecaprenyl-diphosphatase [Microbacterium resistens]|uniref:Undecaprenyl-diphosphatase n=1 Tax=Microbacterium resistens TaxID=156977 RepID=A0ABU1SAU7_9MICO|nr:phosphatase PAP2 family protein [Microbacterium resistens]MDR6866746.1 undecaprenyl-diphosphatase [Microbacterium resistens]